MDPNKFEAIPNKQGADRARFSEITQATTPFKGRKDGVDPKIAKAPTGMLGMKQKSVDFAVVSVNVVDLKNGSGKVTAVFKNLGDGAGKTPIEIKVQDDTGKQLLHYKSELRLRKNGQSQIERQFPVGGFAPRDRTKRVTARAEVSAKEDGNASNNWKQDSSTMVQTRANRRSR